MVTHTHTHTCASLFLVLLLTNAFVLVTAPFFSTLSLSFSLSPKELSLCMKAFSQWGARLWPYCAPHPFTSDG